METSSIDRESQPAILLGSENQTDADRALATAVTAVCEVAKAIVSGDALNIIPELNIVVDLGGSLTKVVVIDKKGKRVLMGLKSTVSEAPLEIIEDKANQFLGNVNPESRMWTVLKDGRAFAVGTFAREHFRGSTNIELSKLKLAVPKTLTALWVIKERLKLASEFSASISFLLPAGECVRADIEELKQTLLPELSSFTTPSGKMRVSVVRDLLVKPEGAGILLYHQKKIAKENTKKKAKEDIKKKRVAFLGVGYRNSNVLIWKNGGISERDRHTDDLGFSYLLSEASHYIGSALTNSQLNELIISCGWNIDKEKLNRYLKSIGEINRSESIESGLKKAQKMYMHYLKSWLESVGANRVDSIVTFGGAAEFLKAPLTQYFESISITDLYWHGDVKISEKLLNEAIVDESEGGLDVRFIDPLCYLHILNDEVEGYLKHGFNKLLKESSDVK